MNESHRLVQKAAAIILAGGKGTRLGALTRHDCKPALPFGGAYRNIDFTLSNCVNSGVRHIGVATQYRDASLVQHLEQVWQIGADHVVTPWRSDNGGYKGTADAVFQNWARIEAFDPRLVLILAGDHVYKMDYRPMLMRHIATGADITVGSVEVPISEARQFGVMSVDRTNRVSRFLEKPKQPESLPGRPGWALGSMGIYVFNREMLDQYLSEDARIEDSSHDFGRDLIPRMIKEADVFAYLFTKAAAIGGGYWRDIGTVSAYWAAHMEFLDGVSGFRLDDSNWPLQPVDSIAAGMRSRARWVVRSRNVTDSVLSEGSNIDCASVRRCVLFRNVNVASRTRLSNAVVLPNVEIGRECRLANVVVDAGVRVPDGTVIMPESGSNRDAEPTLITADTDFLRHRVERPVQEIFRDTLSDYVTHRTAT